MSVISCDLPSEASRDSVLESSPLGMPRLPPELMQEIFSCLSSRDLAVAAQVSSYWSDNALRIIEKREFKFLKKSILSLGEELALKEGVDVVLKLSSVMNRSDFGHVENFSQLKTRVEGIRNRVIGVLKKADAALLDRLTPCYFVQWAKIHQFLDEMDRRWLSPHAKSNELWDFSRILLEEGEIRGALEVANKISICSARSCALYEVALQFLKRNQVQSGLAVARNIPNERIKNKILGKINSKNNSST